MGRVSGGVGLVLAGLAAALPAGPAVAGRQPDPVLGEVRAAWEKRQAATKTVRVAWEQTNFYPRGSVTAMAPVIKGEGGKPVPYEDATHRETASLLLDGPHVRFKDERMAWDEPSRQFQKTVSDLAYTNGTNTRLSHPGALPYPSATVNKTPGAVGYDLTSWPPRAAFRGLDPGMMNRLDFGIYTTARHATLEGRQLVELVRPRDESRGEVRLWVDPARDFAAHRYEEYDRGGKVQRRITVTHRRHESGVWIPQGWTVLVYDEAKLLRSTTAAVTALDVGPPTTADDFRIELPVGTKVVDTTGEGPKEYVVRADRSPREILPGEGRAPHEDQMTMEPGDLLPGGRPGFVARNWRWLLAAAGCAVAAAVVVAVRRNRGGLKPGAGAAG